MLLFSAGWNDNGQLGRYVEFEEDENEPCDPVDVKSSEIKCIASGMTHSIVVYKDGSAVGWGSNHSRQIGLPEMMIYPSPTVISSMSDVKIEAVSCCSYATIFLSDVGDVYVAGKAFKQPTKILIDEPCIKVCGGYENPWAIGKSGKAYEIIKSKINVHQMNSDIFAASSGKTFSIIITKDGTAYGLGEIVDNSGTFQPIKSLSEVKVQKVCAHARHCLVLSDEGRVFSWGNGDNGQLGLGDDIKSTKEFMLIKELSYVVEMSTSALTSCFLTDLRKLYVCGNYGAYLIANSKEVVSKPFDASRIVYGPSFQVACGDNHTLVYSQGELRYQERGLDPEILELREKSRIQQEEIEKIKKLAEKEEEMKRKAEEEAELIQHQQEEEEAARKRKLREEEEERKRRLLEERKRKQLLDEEEETKRKEEEELIRREEEEERIRREDERIKREEEERRKREEEERLRLEEAERLRAEEERRRKEAEEARKKAEEEAEELRKLKEAELMELLKKNRAADANVEELNKELENLKNDLAAKSKCCLLI